MATSLKSDFIIYNDQVQAGMWEGVSQALGVFNAASAGTIVLRSKSHVGDYGREAIFKMISGIIRRRNLASTSAVAAVKSTQDEIISVKISSGIGPIEYAMDAVKKIGKTPQEASFVIGQQIGQAKVQDLINTGVLCVETAIQAQSSLVYDATGQSVKTLTTAHLVSGLSKMGDASERVKAWVMHSKAYFDLTKEQIAGAVTNVADRVIYGATPGTLNRPVVISDIPALINDVASTDTYNVLGLVQDAVVVEESEQSDMVSDIVTGLDNLVVRLQGEYAVNIGCKGVKWNISGGGANPDDTALGTTTNWTKVATSVKDLPGVRILVQ